MRCPACATENRDTARFCAQCGSKLERACPKCGAAPAAGAKFCDACGTSLAEIGGAAAAQHAAPESYTPAHLAREILRSRAALEGERKIVTVLFADIVNSTHLIEDMDPEQSMHRLRPALDAMVAAVHEFEGTVNRMQGDGLIALFGAPIAHEDHAARACLAALAMQKAIGILGDDAIAVRVGLNSGQVVVHAIRNDLTIDYEARGPTVHLAARMEQLASPGTVRVTGETFRLAEGFVHGRALDPVPVKGVSEPVDQFELTGAADVPSRWAVRAARGLSRFVGRGTEFETIARALERAARGHGQVVAVVGEPGIGKSRLLHEFARSDHVADWLVRTTGTAAHGSNTPYLPLGNLLRLVVGAEDRDTQADVTDKLRHSLQSLDPELLRFMAPLSALLDLPIEDASWHALDPEGRRRAIIDAIKALAVRRSESAPLMLAFEDLHWIDQETQAVLDSLVDAIGRARILLLVTYRPGYQHGWAEKSFYTGVHLDPLTEIPARDLLMELVGADSKLDGLRRLLMEKTDGLPLFIEEAVRALVELDVLKGAPGQYRLDREVSDIEMPASVQAVLAARIDRLAPDDKALLQTASVIGRTVPLPLLQATSGLSESALRTGLATLQDAEFLYETQIVPHVTFVFKHALTERAAYEGLLETQRRDGHARVANAIETLHSERLDEHVELLGYHALNGHLWDKALGYFRRAGNKAVARSAYREAVTFFEQALMALEALPQNRDSVATAVDLRLELRPALGALARYQAIHDHLVEAERHARSIDDPYRQAQIAADKIHVLYQVGELSSAIDTGVTAARLAETVGDRRILVQAHFNLGQAYFFHGEFRRAIDTVAAFIDDLKGPLRHERIGSTGTSACIWLGNVAGAQARLGKFAAAFDLAEEATRIAGETARPFDFCLSHLWLGIVLEAKGDVARATHVFESIFSVARENEIGFAQSWGAFGLGHAYTMSGRVDEARSVLEDGLARSRASKLLITEIWCLLGLTLVCRETRALNDALGHGTHALDLARKHGYRWCELVALRMLGEALARCDASDRQEAEQHLLRSANMAETLEALPDMAHAHRTLGALYLHTDRQADARAHLTQAAALYRDMEMTFWLPETEAQLAQATSG